MQHTRQTFGTKNETPKATKRTKFYERRKTGKKSKKMSEKSRKVAYTIVYVIFFLYLCALIFEKHFVQQ